MKMKKDNSKIIPEGHAVAVGMYVIDCTNEHIKVSLKIRDQKGMSFSIKQKIPRKAWSSGL